MSMAFSVRITARLLRTGQLNFPRTCISNRWLSTATSAQIADQQPLFDNASAPLPPPTPDGVSKNFDQKILKIVDDIAKLTLLEVSQLNDALKETLNLPDAPAMSAYAPPPPSPSSAQTEEAAATVAKTSFTVKLLSFDDTKKIPIVKEIKSLVPGFNLVQAKKFVESSSEGPQVVRADINKEEAEKLKADLEKIGATCAID